MRAIHLVMACAVVLAGCSSDPPAGIVCTEEARPGIVVHVRAEPDGAPAADGAVLRIHEGSFVQVVDQTIDGLTLFGATERKGVYLVTIAKEGFETWSRNDVIVEQTADGCHVITVQLEARLQPLPAPSS
jgi:hypothetical protein